MQPGKTKACVIAKVKMVREIITVIPPEIITYYDKLLLFLPFPPIGDSLVKFKGMFEYILEVAEKLKKFPVEYMRFKKLTLEYFDLYERIKTKEENQGATSRNRTKEPFYFVRIASRRHERILTRLRFRAKTTYCVRKSQT